MIRPLRTCFVIADGAHARWVTRDADTGDFRTVRQMHAGPDDPAAPAERRDGAHEPHETGRREAATFAAEVARATVDAGRLVIVAPGRLIGEIEAHLAPAVRDRVVGRLPKDLTKAADHALGRWLRSLEL